MTDNQADRHFQGEIRVAARVIDFLSSGLYENAAACMKELINNSYDADATEVVVSVKPDADVIAIEDDGIGMNHAQFVEHFSRVAESHKRDSGQATELGRKKIGKIGIGFIAANELCDEMEIYSTQQGSTDLLHVTIKFGDIRNRSFGERRRGESDVHKGDFEGDILETDSGEHFTKVYLKKIRESARPQFIKETGRIDDTRSRSIYGLKLESVRDLLARLDGWDELDLYSQTRLRIGLNVPVRYLPQWTLPKDAARLEPFTERALAANFRVIYDGTELTKPTILTDQRGTSRLQVVRFEGDHVSVHGYMFARHGVYKPRELNGVLLRIRESAVGEYDNAFLGFPKQIEAIFQDWTTCELYVDGELDDALNIDRRTLRDTHEAFVELQTWFIDYLREFLRAVHNQMYTAPSAKRKAERAERERDNIRKVAQRVKAQYGQEAAAELTRTWVSDDDKQQPASEARKLTRTYTIAEIYQIAIDVAQQVLPAELADRYISELTRRLRD